MRATALCCTLAALGCGSGEPSVSSPAPPGPRAHGGPEGPPLDENGKPIRSLVEESGCNAYRDVPGVFGFCLVQWAGRGQGDGKVDSMCRQAGDWESECRHAWVTSRSNVDSQWSTDELLNACPNDAGDCRFEVLDMRPTADAAKQIQLCFENAGNFAGDCIAHALERWVRTQPSPEEIQRVAQVAVAPDRIGQYVAALKVCFGSIDECVGSPSVKGECLSRVPEIERDEAICARLRQSPGTPQVPMGP